MIGIVVEAITVDPVASSSGVAWELASKKPPVGDFAHPHPAQTPAHLLAGEAKAEGGKPTGHSRPSTAGKAAQQQGDKSVQYPALTKGYVTH